MKIFAYGCSFTSYNWPSYADILGLQHKVYNRGASGSGNERIFYTFMEDIKASNISKNDLVITQWSGVDRFNYLTSNNQWIGDGMIANNPSIYSKVKGWYNPEYEHEKSINLILSARAILGNIGCKHIEMSLYPISPVDETFLENDLQGTYTGSYMFNEFSWKTFKDAVYIDPHPTVLQHYDIAVRVAKESNIDLNVNTKILNRLHKKISRDLVFDIEYSFKDVQ